MIQLKGLRLGNWFLDETGRYQNIGHLQNNFYGVFINGIDPNLFPDKFNPIHLTPEILEKAGFEIPADGVIWHEQAKLLLRVEESYYGWKYNLLQDKEIQLKHLHQLQNLYFALTGEELNINL